MDHGIRCRCGKILKLEDKKGEQIVFCKDCYMNYHVEITDGKISIKKFYYFPDD
ncbi:MAG: hypothetical protein RXR31_07840 [Thermoproteota archaeon]|jgi:hypothetical protein